jgi:hypothetical protein
VAVDLAVLVVDHVVVQLLLAVVVVVAAEEVEQLSFARQSSVRHASLFDHRLFVRHASSFVHQSFDLLVW